MIPRIFYEEGLKTGGRIVLNTQASGHLLRVLRLRVGDSCRVFDGRGGEYEASLVTAQKHQAILEVGKYQERDVELSVPVHLGQAVSRGDRMDYAIQKAVECGVHSIQPLLTARCSVNLKAERAQKRQAHWQAVAVSAAEQSGRCLVPQIALPQSLEAWMSQPAPLQFYCDPNGQADALVALKEMVGPIKVLVGPESGLSSEECEVLRAASFIPLSLGPRILRTETAPVAALTRIAQALVG